MTIKLCESCKYYQEHMHISCHFKKKMCVVPTWEVLSLKDVKYNTEECELYEVRKHMSLKPLAIEKNYATNIYYNPNTNNKYNIKEVEQVVVKYKDNTEKAYELQHDTDCMRDMGCSAEIVKCFVLEEFKEFTVRLYLSEILSKGHEVFVVDGDKYEIQPVKHPTVEETIEELLEEKARIEECLKDDSLPLTTKHKLKEEVIHIGFRIANLKRYEEMKNNWAILMQKPTFKNK